jgi:chemotaxis protein MotB
MAGKKKKAAGAPTWMVTFADMMALLLCLFVLLLSFSEMDVAKFKIMAGEMEQAFGMALKSKLTGMIEFRGTPEKRAFKDARKQKPEEFVPLIVPPSLERSDEYNTAGGEDAAGQYAAEELLAADLRDALYDEIENGMLMLERVAGDVVIRFPSHVVYPSGSDTILPSTLEILDRVSKALAQTSGTLVVSGHTDDIPISTDRYRSNWDLSSARAASVVHYLLRHNLIDAGRISATGFADSRPLVPNDSPENRSKNRRVEISIRAR